MKEVLQAFGLSADSVVEPLGHGHIHFTYLVKTSPTFVLQRVNKSVFKQPEHIASNLRHAAEFLAGRYPDYPFLRSRPDTRGDEMFYDSEGFPWRLFPFREGTVTIETVSEPREAYKAANAFAGLTRKLDGIDVRLFRETIPQFHDLSWRFTQFEEALANPAPGRIEMAGDTIEQCLRSRRLVEEYRALADSKRLPIRITHNDTKINNVLFDSASGDAIMVIDLDTLMPGYFLYDLGDMVRTYVSPVSEEERDLSKIRFRRDYYEALLDGYQEAMKEVMTSAERDAIPFAGKMMTYIMALRFLADFLRGDTYYKTTYPGQNLVRARNQLAFLELIP